MGDEPSRAEPLQEGVEAADMALLIQDMKRWQIHVGIKSVPSTYQVSFATRSNDEKTDPKESRMFELRSDSIVTVTSEDPHIEATRTFQRALNSTKTLEAF